MLGWTSIYEHGLLVTKPLFQALRCLEQMIAYRNRIVLAIERQHLVQQFSGQIVGHERGPLRFPLEQLWAGPFGQ